MTLIRTILVTAPMLALCSQFDAAEAQGVLGAFGAIADAQRTIAAAAFSVGPEQKAKEMSVLQERLNKLNEAASRISPGIKRDPNLVLDAGVSHGNGAAPSKKLNDAAIVKAQTDVKNAIATLQGNAPDDPRTLHDAAEALVRENRPSFVVCGQNVWVPPPDPIKGLPFMADHLAAMQAQIGQLARATGYLSSYDVKNGTLTPRGGVGTVVAIGQHTLLTNRHVVEDGAFAHLDNVDPSKWDMETIRIAKVQFPEQYDRCTPSPLPPIIVTIKRVIYADAAHDVAFLETNESMPVSISLPKAIDLDQSDALAVIGYPDRPAPGKIFTDQLIDDLCHSPNKRVPFLVERLSPGEYIQNLAKDGELAHDALTWHGSSGSPILSLATGDLVGLQASGLESPAGDGYNIAVRTDTIQQIMVRQGISAD